MTFLDISDMHLMEFDKILTTFYKILIIYVKTHQIHVKLSRIRMLEKILTLLDCGPENQNVLIPISTISIY